MNLLVITPVYSHFVSHQVNRLASEFDSVFVLVAHPYVPKFWNYRGYADKQSKIDERGLPENCTIELRRFLKLPNSFPLSDVFNSLAMRIFTKRYLRSRSEQLDNVSLIHAHFTWPQGYIARHIAVRKSVPYAVTIHEDIDWAVREMDSRLARVVWEDSSLLIRVNDIDKELFRSRGFDVTFIPNGFERSAVPLSSKDEARSRLSAIRNDATIVLTVANLVHTKGHEYLVRAIAAHREECKDENLHFVFVGGLDNRHRRIRHLIKKHKLDEYITITGPVAHHDVFVWLAASDYFVFPSVSESFGIAPLESLAAGTPVVTTRNGGTEMFIIEGVNGLTCEKKNEESIWKALKTAFTIEWDQDRIRESVQKFEWEVVLETLSSSLLSVAKSNLQND